MLQLLVVALLGAQLATGQHLHQYETFPVGEGHDTECLDPQVHKYYAVGETWATKNQRCKQSKCIKEGGVLYIDRIGCDPVDDIVKLLTQQDSSVLCRKASGNRRKAFPGCCDMPQCKKVVGNRLVSIPRSEYPVLPDVILGEILPAE